jgi:hypothetical protein
VYGVAPNELTSTDWRDPIAGTPCHRHVPARLEPVAGWRRRLPRSLRASSLQLAQFLAVLRIPFCT